MKVVVAMDSFKGSLSASEAVDAVAEAFGRVLPQCCVERVPLSDGGEGLMSVLIDSLCGCVNSIDVLDPLMRPIKADYGVADDIALVEMSSASGLTLLAESERSPLVTTTYGVGVLLRHVVELGYKNIILGLGGSATNDAGLGALQALGLKCFDNNGSLINTPICGKDLIRISKFDTSLLYSFLKDVNIKLVCDVVNPFCGPNGAAYVFAPQKGASADDVLLLDAGLCHVAKIIQRQFFVDIADWQGAGAAGGMAGPFVALVGASISRGIDEVLEIVAFDEKLRDADLVVCGEGCVDAQSFMGKVLSGVVGKARLYNIPLLVVGGKVVYADIVEQMEGLEVIQATPSDMPYSVYMQPDVAYRNIYDAVFRWAIEKYKCIC